MRALLLGLLMTLFPGTSGLPVQQDLTPQQIFTSLSESTISIKINYRGLATARGSGVVIDIPNLVKSDGTYILTAYHVVEPFSGISGKITISYQRQDLPVSLVHFNSDYDLAILHTKEKLPFKAISLAESDPEMYSNLYIMGYPASQIWAPSAFVGILSSKGRAYGSSLLWQVNGWMFSGMSGGPIVNGEGNLVCLTEAFATTDYAISSTEEMVFPLPNVGLCTPRFYIKLLLKNYAVKSNPRLN